MLLRFSLCLIIALFLNTFELVVSAARVSKTIVVDQSGRGHFTTIQSAIDSVPHSNNQWVCIKIKHGVYREKVIIPVDKPFIYLRGKKPKTTRIVWGDHQDMAQSPTFTSFAPNIVAKGIAFVNSHNYPPNKNAIVQAVAARIYGDKSAFYRCAFYGMQDTLWDQCGRHYFKNCSIRGSVDFICGNGQSIYENCRIGIIGEGFITAQAREDPRQTSGFVFKNCRIGGKLHPHQRAYLGRPWRDYARVLVYNSEISNVIHPSGWNDHRQSEYKVKLSTFAEHGNFGAGADVSRRVRWLKHLENRTLSFMTSMSFIDHDNWLSQQP